MTDEGSDEEVSQSGRAVAARRILDEIRGMLAMAREQHELFELVDILTRAQDEAERVVRENAKPS